MLNHWQYVALSALDKPMTLLSLLTASGYTDRPGCVLAIKGAVKDLIRQKKIIDKKGTLSRHAEFDPLTLPPYIDRSHKECFVNVKKTPEQLAAVAKALAAAKEREQQERAKFKSLNVPKEAAKPKSSGDTTPPAPKAAPRPSNTFTLAELALEHKVEPRIYRAAARKIADALVPLQVNNTKYLYAAGDKKRILDFINQELSPCPSPASSSQRSNSSKSTTTTKATPSSSTKQSKTSTKRSGKPAKVSTTSKCNTSSHKSTAAGKKTSSMLRSSQKGKRARS